MNIFLKHGIIFLSSVILTTATIVVPNNLVQNKENARTVWYGFPFEFIAQDFSDIAEHSFYPRYMNFFENWKNISIVDFAIGKYIFSVVLFFMLFEIIIFLLEWLKHLIKRA